MENKVISMSSPWVEYKNKLSTFFMEDNDIKIVYDNDKPEVKLYVTGTDKAEALTKLLPQVKEFGDVKLYITVIPANLDTTKAALIERLLQGNPIFEYAETIQGPMSNPMTFIVMRREVVQYYNDNLGDIHGVRSTLYEELAREIFEDHEGVFFCTDVEQNDC